MPGRMMTGEMSPYEGALARSGLVWRPSCLAIISIRRSGCARLRASSRCTADQGAGAALDGLRPGDWIEVGDGGKVGLAA